MAEEALDSWIRVLAHSYDTEVCCDDIRAKMSLMYFPLFSGCVLHTDLTKLRTTSCKMSGHDGSWSSWDRRYWTARSGAVVQSISRAFLLAETSCSEAKKFSSIISLASGRSWSPKRS